MNDGINFKERSILYKESELKKLENECQNLKKNIDKEDFEHQSIKNSYFSGSELSWRHMVFTVYVCFYMRAKKLPISFLNYIFSKPESIADQIQEFLGVNKSSFFIKIIQEISVNDKHQNHCCCNDHLPSVND